MKPYLLGATAIARLFTIQAWTELWMQGFMTNKEDRNPGVLKWLVREYRERRALTFYVEDNGTSLGIVTMNGWKPTKLHVHIPLALLRGGPSNSDYLKLVGANIAPA